jgi:endoglucanase
VYSGALANSLSFYQTERDGPDFILNALRTAAGHLNDQSAMTCLTPHANSSGRFKGDLTPLGVRINAAGGWWDAGDYLKFVQTTSYTVDLLLAGVRDFPNQMGPGSAMSNFAAEAKFGAGWLLRMWDDSTKTLYYQVGSARGTPRPSATTTSGASLRPTTRSAAPIRSTATSGIARCSVRGRLGR